MQKRGLVFFLLLSIVLVGCAKSDTTVDDGDYIEYYYTMILDDGSIYETNNKDVAMQHIMYEEDNNYNPAETVIGNNEINPKLEEQIIGMNVDEQKSIRLEAEDAYGMPLEGDVIFTFKRNEFKNPDLLKVGMMDYIITEESVEVPYYVTEINGDDITVSKNHPLAGEAVTFDITVVWIEER